MLFAPLGPIAWRWARRDSAAALDADLRALVPGLAVARVGCVFGGCCAGRPWPVAWPDLGLAAIPTAALEAGSTGLLACLTRRAGRGWLALAGLAVVRGGFLPLRAPAAHGAADDWVWAAVWAWCASALVLRTRGAHLA